MATICGAENSGLDSAGSPVISRTRAALAPDQAKPLPTVEGLTDGGAAHPQMFGKGDFRRQAVAHLEPGALDHIGEGIEHGVAARLRLDAIEIFERRHPAGRHSLGSIHWPSPAIRLAL